MLRIAVPAGAVVALTAIAVTGRAAASPGWRITARLPANSTFDGLAASGAGNAWVAGTSCADSSCQRETLLVRHWNGRTWQVIGVPKGYVNSAAEQGLNTVATASASATWLFNSVRRSPTLSGTGVLRWTGRHWGSAVLLPATVLAAVAPTARDVWVFGDNATSVTFFGAPYAARFNGTSWKPVRVPVTGFLASAPSASDIWVAGLSAKAAPGTGSVAIMHYNGKAWRSTPLPGLGQSKTLRPIAAGIAAVGASDAWASVVDLPVPGGGTSSAKSLLLHWNGVKWAVIKVPAPGAAATGIGLLAQDGHGGAWLGLSDSNAATAVGYYLHYANGTWTRYKAPSRNGAIVLPGLLAWIPGTRSLWSVGELLPTGTGSGSPRVIVKYGP